MAAENPWAVPFLVKLTGEGIKPGQTFKIQGIQSGDAFEITFSSGTPLETANLPIVIRVNQAEKALAFNDRKDGKIGKEDEKKNPFKKGERLDIRLRLREDKLQVYANLKFFCEFEYRQPLTSITHLNISGGIELAAVSWGGKHYPVPYQMKIEGGFDVGRQLHISGVPEKKASVICINLLNAKGDHVFHLAARFSSKHAIFNAKLGEAWGTEEVIELPMKPETIFDLFVVNEEKAFQVFFDGAHSHTFTHRGDASNIDRVLIENDVELFGVHIK